MRNLLQPSWLNDRYRWINQRLQRLLPAPSSPLADLPPLLLIGILVTGGLLGVRQLGGLQSLELVAYDQMVWLRPDQPPDPRLLLVEITETDIRDTLKHWPPSDAIIARVLSELSQNQPAAIGVDLVRDIPYEPGHAELVAQLKNPRIVMVTLVRNSLFEAIAPPPNLPDEQIGLVNIPNDPDGVVRRQLLFGSDGQNVYTSFALQLAQLYLKDQGIQSQITETNDLQLGQTIFPRLDSSIGGYQTISSAGYQILLNYRSRANVAERVTLTQVLNRQISPEQVQGRIVLIGVTAPSSRDWFRTPYTREDAGLMAGVVLQAQMTSQILSAVVRNPGSQSKPIPLIWDWTSSWKTLWVCGWAVLGVGLVWRVRRPLRLVGGLGLLLTGLAIAGGIAFAYQGWIPLAAPALTLVLVTMTGVTYQGFQSFQRQQLALKLLGQQTSPEVAQALWQNHNQLLQAGHLPGSKVTATIVFSDIRGFSSLAEAHSPEFLMGWLNEYFEQMTEIVYQHQGIINKFLGDGLMAVFGVPIAHFTEAEIAADARSAVNCAIKMAEQLQQLNQSWKSRGLPVIQIRVGIFTGPVMVGSLGGKRRLEYAVIGDSANIASRLESCEKDRQSDDCRILMTRETLQYLPAEYEVEAWGQLSLKGRVEPVEVYRVLHPNS